MFVARLCFLGLCLQGLRFRGLRFRELENADLANDLENGDSIWRNGGMMERRNGMVEHMEYSEIRNTRNILRHGINGIF